VVDSILPKQWHTYLVNLEPRVKSKPGKTRPCVVVQPSEFGLFGLDSTVVLPITSNVQGIDAFPLRVYIAQGTAGLEKDSDVLIDQILAWDNSLFVNELGQVPSNKIQEIRKALIEFLDLA
jgi:mRNA interferase MazF